MKSGRRDSVISGRWGRLRWGAALSILLAFSARAAVPSIAASDAVTLDEAIGIALEKSPELDQERARAEQARWRQNEALSGFLPTIGLTGHWYFYERTPLFEASLGSNSIHSLAPASPWLDAEASLKWPLFDGLRNFDHYGSAKENRHAADLDFDYGAFSLRERVRLAYDNVLAAQELVSISEKNVRDLEDHRDLVKDQLRAGVATRVDLLRVETQLSNALSEQTNAEDQVEINRKELAQLLGGDGDREIEGRALAGSLPEPSDSVLKAIDEARLGSRPDIEALGFRADAAEVDHRADAKWWVPALSAAAGYDAFTSQITKFTAYTVGLQLSWTAFDGLASYSRAKETLASERIAARAQEVSLLQARTDFETYRRRYRYNLERYRARVDDVRRSSESVRLARVGFKAGTETSTDVLDAEQDLFNARGGAIEARYGALEAMIRFELAIGRDVTHE